MSKKLIFLTSFLLVMVLIGSNVVFGDVIEVRVAAGEDDSEEKVASGAIDLTSSDLEITEEGGPGDNQLVGMRFSNIAIPQGAVITSAYVQFQVDETDVPGDNRPGTKFLRGEAVDNAAAFSDAAFDISSRPATSAEASWDWPEWLTVDEEGPDQQTSDISAVIQEIVDRLGWASGNSLVLIITGSGENAAESFNGEADSAALLHVEFAQPVTITVEEGGDIAAANELAKAGDTIEIAAGTYVLASQILIKDGVTYRGAGQGLTIIDGNDLTRAFAAFGDRGLNNGNENPNDSGPKGWVLEGMTIQNCVADTNNRFSYAGSAFDLLDVFADNDADGSGGLSPEEADADSGGIRLAGPDFTEGTEDDDLHRFAAMDADGNSELSEAELNDQLLSTEDEFGDEDGDGGAITIHNESEGTIANCDFLNNHTPIAGDGDDGGAINITGRSTITINDCFFNGNYACSPTSVAESDETGDADGDGGHIKAQGNNLAGGFIEVGTTLIVNRCVFLNGNAEDDGGAIQATADGIVVRIDSCWFEGNTSWDNGNVLQFPDEDQNEATVTNCVFTNNVTNSDNSPDRMCEVRRNTKFVNCTFVGNIQEDQDLIYNNANDADGDDDGTDDELADTTQVVNCLFANNVVGNGDDVLGSRNNNFTIAATNCLFFGNTLQNGDPADNTQRPDVETGSILSDSLLDADLVPGAGSEAIDGGVDPATVGVTLTNDYNGDARPKGAANDIGAFEVE
ncbi:MAG: hypothetical protein FVQ84_15645 [Planctomycetes bacterium]|nr:hypothetical protein [Planctomycetota bacterium]